MTTDEQIIAAAGKPVAHKDTVQNKWGHHDEECEAQLIGLEGWEQLDDGAKLYTANAILSAAKPLRDRIAELSRQLSDYEQANTDIHKWRNNYRREIARLLTQRNAIACAASDVIDRWNSPKWKDLPHTGTYIQALADAVAAAKGGAA